MAKLRILTNERRVKSLLTLKISFKKLASFFETEGVVLNEKEVIFMLILPPMMIVSIVLTRTFQ